MADKGTTLTDRLIAAMDTVVDDIDTKIGENTDAAGTTTLFARLRQIVDNYLEKGLLNGTGTVLPDNKSIYDELGGSDSNSYPIASDTKFIKSVALTGEVAYSISDILKISATEKIKNFIAKTGGTEVPASKSLIDILGTQYVDAGGNPDVDTIREHLKTGLLNGTGTVLPSNKSVYDFLLTTDTAGTHDITTANDKVETDVVEISDTTRYGLSIYFDLNALVAAVEGGTVTIKMYNKIDESTYREVGEAIFIVGTTTTHPNFEIMRINHNVKFTIQCSTDVTVTRTINYRYIKESKE